MKINKTTVHDVTFIEIPKIKEPRGNLGIVEETTIPFDIKRVYYLYDVPSDAHRGGHAHKNLKQVMIALSGSFDVKLDDGEKTRVITLNKPDVGLLLIPGIWRELENFSSGSVCLVLASEKFEEPDYIRDKAEFDLFKRS